MIPDVEVLGAKFAAVARVRSDVHRWRQEHGWQPELDPAWFRCWSEPDQHDHVPLAAVELRGILVRVPGLSGAVAACATLLTLAPCTVVAPTGQPHQAWPLAELNYYGVGAVAASAAGSADLVLHPQDRSAEFGPSLFSRWLLEVLYSKVLAGDPELTSS